MSLNSTVAGVSQWAGTDCWLGNCRLVGVRFLRQQGMWLSVIVRESVREAGCPETGPKTT